MDDPQETRSLDSQLSVLNEGTCVSAFVAGL